MKQLQLMKDLAANIKQLSEILGNFANEQESGIEGVKVTPPAEEKDVVVSEPKEKRVVITIEQVRSVLAELSRNGHQPEVKALITKYGADKLTALNPDCFEELLKEAEAI